MIITHNEGIAGMADRIIRIHDGKIISNNPNKRISVKELVRHYMVYGMIPAFAGDVLGVLGSIPFSRAFCNFYFKDAEYIDYAVKIPYHLMLAAVLIPVAVYGLVSYLVLQGVLQSDIIPLLRGIGKEKVSGILRKSSAGLSFVYNIRAVTLNGFRSITMVIGIAIATLCIILGGSFQDAYADLLEEKVPYAMLGGQYEYGFKEFQTQNPYGGDGVFDISFGAKQDDSRFNLIGYEEQNQILDLVLSSKENAADIIERPVEEYNVIISKEPLTIPSELLRKNSSLKDYQEQAKNLSMTAGIVLKLLKVLGMLMSLPVKADTILSGFAFLAAAYLIAMLLAGRKCKKVDLVESLKCPL